jgi:hypothetical protein
VRRRATLSVWHAAAVVESGTLDLRIAGSFDGGVVSTLDVSGHFAVSNSQSDLPLHQLSLPLPLPLSLSPFSPHQRKSAVLLFLFQFLLISAH